MGGDEFLVRAFHGKLRMSFFVGRDIAPKYTREGEGHAEEGWVIDVQVVSTICTDFNDALCETLVSLTPDPKGLEFVQRPGWGLAADFSQYQSSMFR